MRRRAVSDLVGFVLIFAIIMSGATFALVVGQDGISNIRTNEQSVNAERAMVLVGNSLNGLDRARSASTVGTINLNDGSLRATSTENVSVRVTNATTGTESSWLIPTGSLAYDLDDTVIRYENGMVLRSDRGNGIAISAPYMTCTADRATISVVTLNNTGSQQVGSGRVSVVAYQDDTRLLYPQNRSGAGSAPNATDVYVEINSSHPDVWNETLEGHPGWNWTDTGGEHQCDVGHDGRVILRRTIVDLRLER